MYVKQLIGPDDDDQDPRPVYTWEEIEEAIKKLDGNKCTAAIFGPGGEYPYMGVSGGNGGYYTTDVTFDNDNFHILLNPEKPVGKVSLVCGGQQDEYPAVEVTSLALVLKVAQTFVETGELDASYEWKLA